MKKILLNNLSLKILALIIGCITWFTVMYSLNPIATKTISVPVKLINEYVLTDKNWVFTVDGKSSVDVTIKAKSFDMNKITADDLYLYVDMRYLDGMSSNERRGTIQYQIKNNDIDSISIDKDWLIFKLEELVTREYKIDVRTSGTVAENFIASEQPKAVPETIKVKGPISEVDKIVKVAYDIEMVDASEEINVEGSPMLLDADGNELKELRDVEITPNKIKVCQPISQTKNVKIECENYIGEPATGYGLADITLNIDSIKVSGYKAVLSNFFAIEIPAEMINIEGLAANRTFPIDLDELQLPEGISLLGGDHIVNVTVKIEKKKQNNFRLQLPDDITINDKTEGYTYSFDDTSIYITVEGISDVLSGMESVNIIASMNVYGLEPGSYSLPLNVILPEDINLVGAVYVTINIAPEETLPPPTLPTEPLPTEPLPTEPLPTMPTIPTLPTESSTLPEPVTEESIEMTTEEPTMSEATSESTTTAEEITETETTAETEETTTEASGETEESAEVEPAAEIEE